METVACTRKLFDDCDLDPAVRTNLESFFQILVDYNSASTLANPNHNYVVFTMDGYLNALCDFGIIDNRRNRCIMNKVGDFLWWCTFAKRMSEDDTRRAEILAWKVTIND